MNVVGLDCEMVEVEPRGTNSVARVSIVNFDLEPIYNKFVRQNRRVLCYRTPITGITRDMLIDGKLFKNVRKDVLRIIRNSILVGHSIHHDLKVLDISRSLLRNINCRIRDTAYYGAFRKVNRNGTPSLKQLAKVYLNWNIQTNHHDSIQDAQAAVMLYKKVRHQWEDDIYRYHQSRQYYSDEDSEYDSDEYTDEPSYESEEDYTSDSSSYDDRYYY